MRQRVPASDVEIERSADELPTDAADALRHDVDTTNIALVFNAPGAITNLDADQAHVAGMTRIQFQVVAAY